MLDKLAAPEGKLEQREGSRTQLELNVTLGLHHPAGPPQPPPDAAAAAVAGSGGAHRRLRLTWVETWQSLSLSCQLFWGCALGYAVCGCWLAGLVWGQVR